SVNIDCISNIQFFSNSSLDSIEALLLNNSKQLTYQWGQLDLDNPNTINSLICLNDVDVCVGIDNSIVYYNTKKQIDDIEIIHNGCINNISEGIIDNYNFNSEVNENIIEEGAIKLGLDLQGGMYIQLELDVAQLILNKLNRSENDMRQLIYNVDQNNIDFFESFRQACSEKNIRLTQKFPQYKALDDNEVIQRLKDDRDQALNSAIKVLRNRIDEFGVSEPIIQRFGENRIVVELAGVQDKDRARELIKRTASLELSLVLSTERVNNAIVKIDKYLLSNKIDGNLFANYFEPALFELFGELGVSIGKEDEFERLLEKLETSADIKLDGRFILSNESQEGLSFPSPDNESNSISIGAYTPVYYVSNTPAIVGGMVKDPMAKIAGPGSDNSGQWVINLSMNREGARKWSSFTGRNIGKRVAIVLDNKVFMAPQINSKISGGQTQISGLENANEAQDIANVLSAGELDAPVKIVEERSVSPSLGKDSIESGRNALMYAFISILIFILFYYRVSGLIANISLFLNIIFILSLLSILGATLTLPGIAGLILTIGIAIDSNVIIFERIKEEIGFGKNAISAVRSGYKRAFITIMDANITTLIAAFVLANIGSGPIKGFAITLSIGIMCSMFTAIFITRTFYMIILQNKKNELSI
ncbi:MAG: protein translocase subunit SecD, partial [Candidatus Marinimicrobia bacterium]|nr:protein translocase subunit SecD [Candidatus Neomarinimicrobiota bacterium]